MFVSQLHYFFSRVAKVLNTKAKFNYRLNLFKSVKTLLRRNSYGVGIFNATKYFIGDLLTFS